MKKAVSWISKEEVSGQKDQTQERPAKPAEDILRARELLDRGDFAGSLKESQEILSRSSKEDLRDEALFTMGLIYAHTENPQRDLGKALYSFRTVLKEYPQTHLAAEAKVLVGVLQENQKLGQENQKLGQMVRSFKQENEELSQAVQKVKQENQELSRVIEKSKQVDIEVEEKKREKAR